ncbi:MAG: hypothetical protein M5R36_24400 [Deltaproteobacteria bacterium]|nr:hypothetical protein [Deltaproteobacteria bacterium]
MIAATGAQAVAAVESLICGSAAVASPSVAQGYALAGRRAAGLPGDGDAAGDLTGFAAPYVQHTRGAGTHAAVELVAGSVQEAADHALAAHLIADRTGRPVVCVLDDALAERLELLRLPTPQVVRQLFGGKAGNGKAEPNAGGPAEIVGAAFRDVALATRRPCQAVMRYQTSDAEVVLVAGGHDADRAQAAADLLRARNIKAGVVSVGLRRPFPREELVDALRGKPRVVVLGPENAPVSTSSLFYATGNALAEAKAQPPTFEAFAPAPEAGAFQIAAHIGGADGAPEPAIAGVRVAARPAGPWSERVLRDVAVAVGLLAPVDIATHATGSRRCARLDLSARGFGAAATDDRPAGALFVAHPSLLDFQGLMLADDGAVVLNVDAAGPVEAWRLLSETQRRRIEERRGRVWTVDLAAATGDASDRSAAVRWAAAGALLAAVPDLAGLVGRTHGVTDAVRKALDENGETERAGWFAAGAAAVRRLDPVEIDRAKGSFEQDFRPAVHGPRLPAASEPDPSWSAEVLRFYATGRREGTRAETLPCLPLKPATMAGWFASGEARDDYPFYLPDGPETPASPLARLVEQAADQLAADGKDISVIRDHLGRLVQAAADATNQRGGSASAAEVLDEATNDFAAVFDASEAGSKALREQAVLLRGALPNTGRLAGLGRRTPPDLVAAALSGARARVVAGYVKEAKSLARRLRDVLAADATHDEKASSPKALESAMGGSGGRLFDAGALAKTLPAHRGSRRLEPERRARIEDVLATLDRFLGGRTSASSAVFVSRRTAEPAAVPSGATLIVHDDAPAAAIGLFDGFAEETLDVLRALRVARLEADGAYDPAAHDEPLANLRWEGCAPEELLLVRPIVVFESAAHLRAEGLGSLSELLRSARPVRVIVTDDGAAAEPGARFFRDPALLALSHREAFVLRSTLARPGHVLDGLRRVAAAPCPAVAVIAVAPEGAAWPAGGTGSGARGARRPVLRLRPRRGGNLGGAIRPVGKSAAGKKSGRP